MEIRARGEIPTGRRKRRDRINPHRWRASFKILIDGSWWIIRRKSTRHSRHRRSASCPPPRGTTRSRSFTTPRSSGALCGNRRVDRARMASRGARPSRPRWGWTSSPRTMSGTSWVWTMGTRCWDGTRIPWTRWTSKSDNISPIWTRVYNRSGTFWQTCSFRTRWAMPMILVSSTSMVCILSFCFSPIDSIHVDITLNCGLYTKTYRFQICLYKFIL